MALVQVRTYYFFTENRNKRFGGVWENFKTYSSDKFANDAMRDLRSHAKDINSLYIILKRYRIL